ncbi:MAG: diacylglycerol kinase [Candidatus Electrothrix sp. YB6]
MNEKPNGAGIQRIFRAFSCSLQGLQAALRSEQAFVQELLFVAVLLPVGLLLGQNGAERAVLTGCLFLILITELLNSAIEAVVDRIGTEHHELSGRAKDLGSAAVLLSFLNWAAVWLLILCG